MSYSIPIPRTTPTERTDTARAALAALAEGRHDDARALANKALAPDATQPDTRYRAPVLAFLLDFCAYRAPSTRTWE